MSNYNDSEIKTISTTGLDRDWLSLIHDLIIDFSDCWGGHPLSYYYCKEQIGDELVWVLKLWPDREYPLTPDDLKRLKLKIYGALSPGDGFIPTHTSQDVQW